MKRSWSQWVVLVAAASGCSSAVGAGSDNTGSDPAVNGVAPQRSGAPVAVSVDRGKGDSQKLFDCVAAPVGVTLPPSARDRKFSARREARAPACPEGQVPQPLAVNGTIAAAHEAGFAPVAKSPILGGNDHVSVGGYQTVAGAGTYVEQYNPILRAHDKHSLAEFSVNNSSGDRIELGWIVSPDVFVDSNTHVFLFHHVSGGTGCYNGCSGWVQVSSTHYPGMTTPTDGTYDDYALFHWDGAWWASYQDDWMGYFPDSVWSNRLTESTFESWWGEVGTATDPACAQMGNGRSGSGDPGAAQFVDVYTLDANFNASSWNLITNTLVADTPSLYTGGGGTYTSGFRYGGDAYFNCP